MLLVYEDFPTGVRAKQAVENLGPPLSGEDRVELMMWKVDQLALRPLRAIATEDAKAADLILFSLHGDQRLEHAVEHWLEEWPAQRRSSAALAVWLDPDKARSETADATRSLLKSTSEQGGMEWIPSLAELDEMASVEAASAPLSHPPDGTCSPHEFSRRLSACAREVPYD